LTTALILLAIFRQVILFISSTIFWYYCRWI